MHIEVQKKHRNINQSQKKLATLNSSERYDSHRNYGDRMFANLTTVNVQENGSLSIRDRVYKSDIFDIKEVLAKAVHHDFRRKLKPLNSQATSPVSQSVDLTTPENRYKIRSRLFKKSPSKKLLLPMP